MFVSNVLRSTSKRIFTFMPMLFIWVVVIPIPISGYLKNPQAQSANRSNILAEIKAKGWDRIVVCHIPLDKKKRVVCLRIGDLSRIVPEKAIAVGEWIRDNAERWAATQPVLIAKDKILESYFSEARFGGCSGQAGDRGTDIIAMRGLIPRGQGKTIGNSNPTQSCSNPLTASPISSAMGLAYTDIMDIMVFLNAYSQRDDNCGAAYRGGNPGTRWIVGSMQEGQEDQEGQENAKQEDQGNDDDIVVTYTGKFTTDLGDGKGKIGVILGGKTESHPIKTFVGQMWSKVSKPVEEKDVPNAGVGVRGYCFADDPCASSECGKNAATQAFVDMLQNRYGSQACDPAATPSPNSGSACFKVRRGNKITDELRAQLLQESCAFHQRFYGQVEGSTLSSCRPNQQLQKRPSNICADPRAMCTPENSGMHPSNTSSPTPPRPQPIPTRPPGTR